MIKKLLLQRKQRRSSYYDGKEEEVGSHLPLLHGSGWYLRETPNYNIHSRKLLSSLDFTMRYSSMELVPISLLNLSNVSY